MEVEQIQAIANMIQENVKITRDYESDNAYLSLESSGGNIACMTLSNPEIWDEGALQSSALWIIAQMIAEKVVPVVIQQERERIAKGFETHAKSLSTTIGDSDIEYKDFLGGFLWGSVMVLKRIVEGVDA